MLSMYLPTVETLLQTVLSMEYDFKSTYIFGHIFVSKYGFVHLKNFHTVYEWHCKEVLMVGLLPSSAQSLI